MCTVDNTYINQTTTIYMDNIHITIGMPVGALT